jgi:Mg/Co/Ni transporter MgtE
MQSKKMSLIETVTGTTIGFIVSLLLVNIVLPWYGFDVKLTQSISITMIFTIASVLRGYGIRRLFNYIRIKQDYIKGW